MIEPWCPVLEKELMEYGKLARHWSGTHSNNSFSLSVEIPRSVVGWQLARVHEGRHIKTHMAHYDWLQEYLYNLGVAHVFIYRDLRDVAVSQVHHIRGKGKHTNKSLYQAMGFDDALAAVIEGVSIYEGVLERWERYAPWLNDPNTLAVSFEDFKNRGFQMARAIVEHGYKKLGECLGIELKLTGAAFSRLYRDMVRAGGQTEKSDTFRSGRTGGWKEAFTDRHKDLFKSLDNGWLVKLGYEKDDNW